MFEKIYLARHGFRASWISSSWHSPTGLHRDSPLTECGLTQAEELFQHILSFPEDERPTAIFSSPYYRCLQTSQPLAKALGIPIYVEHAIAEWYAPVIPGTGLHPRPGTTASLQSIVSQVDLSWETLFYPSRKGETMVELQARVDGFLHAFGAALAQRLPAEQTRRLLLVSHAPTMIALTRSLTGEREMYMKVGCCSLTTLERRDDLAKDHPENGVVGMFKPILVASWDHLTGGPSREWGIEDVIMEEGRIVEDRGTPGTEHEENAPLGLQVQLSEL